MKVSVIGLGYVGIVTTASLAKTGHEITGFDSDLRKVNDYQNGDINIHEPDLIPLIREGIATGNIRFKHTQCSREPLGDLAIIAVGTPSQKDGSSDLKYVKTAFDWVLKHSRGLKGIVLKSTVPPGTGRKLLESTNNLEGIFYYSSPEFLREGNAIEDFLHPDRVVIGCDQSAPRNLIEELHTGIEAPFLFTDVTTAEMIKLSSNVFLANKISFINTVSDLCDAVGANIDSVQEGIGLDKRIGQQYLKAGVGFGGSCLPKDTRAFASLMSRYGIDNQLIQAILDVNEAHKDIPHEFAASRFKKSTMIKAGILGLSFKPGTNDVREAPSIFTLKKLLKLGATVKAHDPFANDNAEKEIEAKFTPTFTNSIEECALGTNILFVMHTWSDLQEVDWKSIHDSMEQPRILFDARNELDPETIRHYGFEYVSIGPRETQ
jgi:UDPglucose 6-dehydrogenase